MDSLQRRLYNVVARTNFPRMLPPARIYYHNGGNALSLFQGPEPFHFPEAERYALAILERYNQELQKYAFLLGMVWGEVDKESKNLDLFCYKMDATRWQTNPSIVAKVFKNGEYVVDEEKTCEDSIIVFGREGEFRRTTEGLWVYMTSVPTIPGLEGIATFTNHRQFHL